MPDGRFAPSPTGDLHLGNLRTALLAWLFARSTGSRFLIRMEDLDRASVRPEYEGRQLADLAALALDHDGEVVRQSDRLDLYEDAIATLTASGDTYPCYCTRREIQREIEESARAPHEHLPAGAYPGTCRTLTAAERAEREAEGRRPALRLRADGVLVAVEDRLHGRYEGVVDDVVLRRNDGTPAYNLAVVVDDIDQGVGEVVRGDDLLSSTPRQIHLATLLGRTPPRYAHVPLVLAPDGNRLAKRHGAVTLADRLALGATPDEVCGLLAASLGLVPPGEPVRPASLASTFSPETLPREPWTVPEALLHGAG